MLIAAGEIVLTAMLDSLGVPVNERISPDAYPLWGTLDGHPRTYIQICEMDILRDDAVCYARALLDAGVEVREMLYTVSKVISMHFLDS